MTIPGEWLDLLRIGHGVYNTAVALAFFSQGWLGLRILRERAAGRQRDFAVVKKHRSRGPLLVLLGLVGYGAGALLIFLDKGHLLHYPIHNAVGAAIVVLLAATWGIARRITAPDSPWRIRHLVVGGALLILYPVQLLLGLGILL